jgi:hypothetical protein
VLREVDARPAEGLPQVANLLGGERPRLRNHGDRNQPVELRDPRNHEFESPHAEQRRTSTLCSVMPLSPEASYLTVSRALVIVCPQAA